MLQYIYFFIIFLIIGLLYLHIKRQLYVTDNVDEINYIDYELTKYQYHELCYDKIPFVYKYNVSQDEKIFEMNLLKDKYKNYDINVNNEQIELGKYFTDVSSNTFNYSYCNETFLKDSGLYDQIYSKDIFLRPSFTCYYDYDLLISINGNENKLNNSECIFQNKFYGHFIHCIDKPLHIKLVSPKFHCYFEENDINIITNDNIFSNKIQKHIPLFNDEMMKTHKNYCKIKVQNVILQPGDLLYIPSLWFYSYRPENDYNISISYNYMTYMNSILFLQNISKIISLNLQDNIQKLIK